MCGLVVLDFNLVWVQNIHDLFKKNTIIVFDYSMNQI